MTWRTTRAIARPKTTEPLRLGWRERAPNDPDRSPALVQPVAADRRRHAAAGISRQARKREELCRDEDARAHVRRVGVVRRVGSGRRLVRTPRRWQREWIAHRGPRRAAWRRPARADIGRDDRGP